MRYRVLTALSFATAVVCAGQQATAQVPRQATDTRLEAGNGKAGPSLRTPWSSLSNNQQVD